VLRWVALLGLVVVSATAIARAKIVVMDPPLVRACPRGATWDAIDKCLHKQGKPTVLRTLPTARLIQLQQQSGDTSYDGGIFLYMQRGNEWRLAGLYENRGAEYEVLGIESIKVGNHIGYRIDIGQFFRSAVQPDGFTNVPALFATKQTLFCGGDTWRCTEVVTSCDVYVRGGATWSFRGVVSVADNFVKIAGDRNHVGPFCSVAEQEPLGWSQTQ
jgi:hypothetical protein